MRVAYLPLEPYRERYTELLAAWVVRGFEAAGFSVDSLGGEPAPGMIEVGEVLDSAGRCRWALRQTAELIDRLGSRDYDAILVEDMFHPGFEAIPYCLARLCRRPVLATRNYAQSVDVFDFTFPMRSWMRHYEAMVCDVADRIWCGCEIHREHMLGAGWPADKLGAVGLPFNPDDVRGIAGLAENPVARRPDLVTVGSRLDREKNPEFLLAVAERLHRLGIMVAVSSGADRVRSNNPDIVRLINDAAARGVLDLHLGQTKAAYYRLVASAGCHFLCSLQDYVSFTLLEASALGTPQVAPCYRSFPETLGGDPARLYAPWSVDDAVAKVVATLRRAPDPDATDAPARRHGETIGRMADDLKVLISGRS